MTKRQITSAARKALAGFASEIGGHLQEIHDRETDTRAFVARKLTLVGILLDQGAERIASADLGDWREWARESVPGMSPSTVYRVRNAGAVARVIEQGGGDIGEASYLAFVPLYRYLASVKTDDDRTTATTAILGQWSKLTEGGHVPTADEVLEAVEADEVSASRGKGAGDVKRAAASRKAAKAAKTAKASKVSNDVPDEHGSADREACAKAVERAVARLDASLRPAFIAGMLAGLKLRETYAPTTCEAVVKTVAKQ